MNRFLRILKRRDSLKIHSSTGRASMWKKISACNSIFIFQLRTELRYFSSVKNTEQMKKRRRNFTAKMDRSWINLSNSGNQTKYSLMSYNILSQELLIDHIQLYNNIPLRFLEWEERLQRLGNEIRRCKPDILCVQEMQHEHLQEFLQQIKEQRQLAHIYKKKTNARNDGCAIFYDQQKFNLLEQMPLEYKTDDNDILRRGNVALLAKFSVRAEPEKQFVVATTHLLFNPKRENIRLEQACQLLETLQKFAKNERNNLPIILTGDFNSAVDGAVSQLIERPNENFQMQQLDFGPHAVSTSHNFWTKVDHIFFTQPSENCQHALCICEIYQLPNKQQCQSMWKLPNSELGSDHFSLAMRFSIS